MSTLSQVLNETDSQLARVLNRKGSRWVKGSVTVTTNKTRHIKTPIVDTQYTPLLSIETESPIFSYRHSRIVSNGTVSFETTQAVLKGMIDYNHDRKQAIKKDKKIVHKLNESATRKASRLTYLESIKYPTPIVPIHTQDAEFCIAKQYNLVTVPRLLNDTRTPSYKTLDGTMPANIARIFKSFVLADIADYGIDNDLYESFVYFKNKYPNSPMWHSFQLKPKDGFVVSLADSNGVVRIHEFNSKSRSRLNQSIKNNYPLLASNNLLTLEIHTGTSRKTPTHSYNMSTDNVKRNRTVTAKLEYTFYDSNGEQVFYYKGKNKHSVCKTPATIKAMLESLGLITLQANESKNADIAEFNRNMLALSSNIWLDKRESFTLEIGKGYTVKKQTIYQSNVTG